MTNLEDQNTLQFVEELQHRLPATTPGGGMALSPSVAALTGLGGLARAASGSPGPTGALGAGGAGNSQGPLMSLASIRHQAEELPFELRALEVSLDMVSLYLEGLATDLEAASHPALDALTARISTGNLERVRRIKNRMVRLTTRVETLREALGEIAAVGLNTGCAEGRGGGSGGEWATAHGAVGQCHA